MLGGLNAVPILFSVLANKDTVNEVQTLVQTTRAIANLAVTANNRQLMRIHPTGLLQLIDLAQSPFNSVLEAAARALVNLSYDADVARAIVRVRCCVVWLISCAPFLLQKAFMCRGGAPFLLQSSFMCLGVIFFHRPVAYVQLRRCSSRLRRRFSRKPHGSWSICPCYPKMRASWPCQQCSSR